MSFIEPKKLFNFRDHSGYETLSREWFLKTIVFFYLYSHYSILQKENYKTLKKIITTAYG
mgnify:CR=1 FL=1